MCGIAGYCGNGDPRHAGADGEMPLLIAGRTIPVSGTRPTFVSAWRTVACPSSTCRPSGISPWSMHRAPTVIVFNGEIYNFRELRRQLELEGYRFRGHSDTEVLLALYKARGEAMLSLVNGIFAFAIYDLAERSLFLACDAMGVKPLYFSEGREGFVFASELKALVASGQVATSLDIRALSRYLGFLWSPGGATPLIGVSRLGPGEALRVKDGRVIKRWRWAGLAWSETAPQCCRFNSNGRRRVAYRGPPTNGRRCPCGRLSFRRARFQRRCGDGTRGVARHRMLHHRHRRGTRCRGDRRSAVCAPSRQTPWGATSARSRSIRHPWRPTSSAWCFSWTSHSPTRRH